jgi:cobalt/nickel transport protein
VKDHKMWRSFVFASVLCSIFFMATSSWAHFQVILPDQNIVTQNGVKDINISLLFTHPFEQHLMDMEKPAQFGVLARGEKTDLLSTLTSEKSKDNMRTWKATYQIKRPGDHVFYVEPAPYWEPAEDTYIIHYTKTVVNAFGMEEGWDETVGLRAEIIPLTRPYGLWAGNVFQGRVVVDGKPAADLDVEVEFYNDSQDVKAPADPFITQVVRTDDQGVFTYAMPWSGWWGFAALAEAPETKKSPDGTKDAAIELGAVLWVKTVNRN